MLVIHIYVLSLISGSDIVQWMIKNLDIEDQGKGADWYWAKTELDVTFIIIYVRLVWFSLG